MGLSSDEFKEIFEDGFEQRWETESTENRSELRCFECGEVAELTRSGRRNRWRVICENGHEWKMMDFLVEHIKMRDGVADRALMLDCYIDNPSFNGQ